MHDLEMVSKKSSTVYIGSELKPYFKESIAENQPDTPERLSPKQDGRVSLSGFQKGVEN